MKRLYGLGVAVLLAFLLPKGQGVDISQLHPVEILYIDKEDWQVRVVTDTGETGVGETWQMAFADLKETAPGELFVDTAAYLLVTEESNAWLEEMACQLRPSIKVLLLTGEVDWETLPDYLRWKHAGVSLRDYRPEETALPKLMIVEGRYYIE